MTYTLPDNLPSIATAQLPKNYEAAKIALATCNRLDECKDWADKSAALASYAKQADDDELEKYAVRVRARAIRRCGELLKQIEDNKGGRPPKETSVDAHTSLSKNSEAAKAGLSKHQQHTALRVATIPEEEFDAALESENTPTITALAEQGTVKKYKTPAEIIGDRDPEDFQAALHALGALRRFVEMTEQRALAAIVRGCDARDRAEGHELIQVILSWLTTLDQYLNEGE